MRPMVFVVVPLAWAAGSSVFARPVAQIAPTLADYLAQSPVPASLTVGAESRKAEATGVGLSRYNRKMVRLGGVAAIVPITAIAFDDSLKQAPNLYDGLPREAKVMYLMTTLTAAQWRTISTKGIGLSDLTSEQRPVFISLLPKKVKWTKYRVGADHGFGDKVGEGTLDERETPTMRLRIERRLDFNIPLADQPNSYTSRLDDQEAGQPGEIIARRDASEEWSPSDAFGVEVRATVPNVLKKGQLDTSAFNGTVEILAKTTVGDVLATVSAATGREILADLRVRSLSVSFPTRKARAGDLLDALALAVTGTYRKVDATYLLVADVTGAGSRKLKLAIWQEAIQAMVYQRETEWQKAIASAGLVKAVRFDPQNPLSPSEELQKRLERSPYDTNFEAQFFSRTELSAAQREFLDRTTRNQSAQRLRNDVVGLQGTLKYRFVMPDGSPMQTEGWLGQDWQYKAWPEQPPLRPDPVIPIGENPAGAVRPLAVRLSTVAEARQAIELAKAYRFSELWVETLRPEALAVAIRGGLPTRLFVRPWALTTPRPDSDKTLLGESGRAVLARMGESAPWGQVATMIRMQSFPRLGPILPEGDLLSPFDPQWGARRDAFIGLAKTDGLAGMVLMDSMPHGYEKDVKSMQVGGYSRTSNELWGFGYDERARLAFFREKGIDPIDHSIDALNFPVDMYTPFFPRYGTAGALPDDGYRAWIDYRAKANASALNQLRNAIPNLPVLVDVRRTLGALPPLNTAVLRKWEVGATLPDYDDQYVRPQPGDIRLVVAPPARMSDAMADFGNAVKFTAPRPDIQSAVDLTRVSSAYWAELLARWLKKSEG